MPDMERETMTLPSADSWISLSEAQRRCMIAVVSPYRQLGTLDDMGTGIVREIPVTAFFPGKNEMSLSRAS